MIQRQEETRTVWTVAELLKWTEAYFLRLELASPRLDAEILLARAIGKTRLELYTGYHMLVEPDERSHFRSLVERRARREPVAYITGQKEFYSLAFEVSPAVLVPRPETEHLVEAALKVVNPPRPSAGGEAASHDERRLLDMGTGSGCVAVAIAVNAPEAAVDAADVSPQALEVARRNAEKHGVSKRIRFLEGDLFAAIPRGSVKYHVIVSNPPYVPAAEFPGLMDDVRLHEPQLALLDTRGPERDGLGFYRELARHAGAWLEPAGVIAVEVGAGQAPRVRALLESASFRHRETVRDHGGIDRVVVCEASV